MFFPHYNLKILRPKVTQKILQICQRNSKNFDPDELEKMPILKIWNISTIEWDEPEKPVCQSLPRSIDK
jgi:hypothetical protein